MTSSWDVQPPGRAALRAANGVAATAHPLATSAALEILQAGGNAIDAALAASAVLCVVRPDMNGVGGDGFLQVVEPDGSVVAYNAGGTAGSGAHLDGYADGIPNDGLRAACIPGLPDCWALLHERGATLPLRRLFGRALELARDGFPVSADLASAFAEYRDRLASVPESACVFLPSGEPPRAGQPLVQLDLARTLEAIAEDGRAAFYQGPTGERIAQAFAQQAGGLITADDLRAHRAEEGEPLRAQYRGHVVTEQPPASQGHILLQMLLMLDPLDLCSWGHLSADSIHTMIEVKKLAFADRTAMAGDPRVVTVDWDHLLSPERAARRVGEVDPQRAQDRVGADSRTINTTQFVVGDRDGRAVTFIQSVFRSFGSGVVVGGTGVLLNNRMGCFSTDPSLPNVVAPGKRTVHTLNTYTVLRDGELLLAGGTPGADFQVQTNLQIVTAMVDSGLDVCAAVDAPRWGHTQGRRVVVEDRLPGDTRAELERRGHELVVPGPWARELGCAMLLSRDAGSWQVVADQRRENAVAGF